MAARDTDGEELDDGDRVMVEGIGHLGDFQTKSEQVYTVLREAILSGAFNPGERLTTTNLAERLGVSPTPVREALKKLESDHLVVGGAHSGFNVAESSYLDLLQNLILRMSVESIAACLSAEHFRAEDLNRLRRLVDEMDQCIDAGDWQTYARLNKTFHHGLIEKCPLPVIRRYAIQLWELGERTRQLFARLEPIPMKESNAEHRAMVDSVASGDLRTLADLLRRQKWRGIGLLLESVGSEEQSRIRAFMMPVLATFDSSEAGMALEYDLGGSDHG